MTKLVRSEADIERALSVEKADSDLRILFVIDSQFPGLGGAESQAKKLATALNDRGVQVEYLAPSLLPTHLQKEVVEGILLQRIVYPQIKYIGSVIMMVKFAAFLIKNRDKYDYTHIHVTRLLAATAGAVKPITKIPIITKISGFFEFEGGILDPRKRWNPLNALMLLAMKNVEYVQTISVQTQEKLMASGFRDDQIALIPNGIDTSEPPMPMPDSETFYIGYCGRLREVKGVHVLLDGYAKFKALRPDASVKLLLAGSGIAETFLKNQSEELGIDDAIDWLGAIEDTAEFYARLNLYVQPSFAEGLPNSVIEAMHASRAVLATDVGGNQDLVEENVCGHLFPAGDSDKLAELLVNSYDNPQDNVRMGNKGRAIIEAQYGMDGVIDKLLSIYHGR